MKYTYLEHRADLYVQGEGRDRNEALESIADGLFNVTGKGIEKEKIEFEETGIDFQDLIVNIFTRILGEMDAENLSGAKIKVLEITDNKAKIEFYYGENVNKMHVKAVTLHGFEEIKEKNNVKIKILFDT
jgi:SHS2 domain-containing protein